MAVRTNHQMRTRIRGLTVLFALIGFGLVGVRLLYMQVFNHDFYVQQATALQTRDTFITPEPRQDLRREHAGAGRVRRGRAHHGIDPKAVVDEGKVKKGITAERPAARRLRPSCPKRWMSDYDTVMEKLQKTELAVRNYRAEGR